MKFRCYKYEIFAQHNTIHQFGDDKKSKETV